jgi:hypothetical protein
MKKSVDVWKNIARDFIALGSIPFFILVLVRIWILDQPLYLAQFILAGIFFFGGFLRLRKNMVLYSGLSLVILFFTGVHYADQRFWIFGSLIYVGLIGGLYYLEYDKNKIWNGVLWGAIICFLTNYLFSKI